MRLKIESYNGFTSIHIVGSNYLGCILSQLYLKISGSALKDRFFLLVMKYSKSPDRFSSDSRKIEQ